MRAFCRFGQSGRSCSSHRAPGDIYIAIAADRGLAACAQSRMVLAIAWGVSSGPRPDSLPLAHDPAAKPFRNRAAGLGTGRPERTTRRHGRLCHRAEQPFDYLVPERLRDRAELGRRVRVPLGKSDRLMTGYLVGLAQRQVDPQRLKPLAQVVDERSLLGGPMLRLTEWMADYYLCPWGQVLEAVVPAGVRWQAGTRDKLFVRLAADALAQDRRRSSFRPSSARSSICWRQPTSRSIRPRSPRRSAARWRRSICCANGAAGQRNAPHRHRGAGRAGRGPRRAFDAQCRPAPALDAILAALESRQSSTVLLHGVTGSGKTEVYIQAIRGSVALRPASDRAGARNQPDAADRAAVSLALRPRGGAAQPPVRRRAASALAADRRRRGAGGGRRTAPSSPPRRTWA